MQFSILIPTINNLDHLKIYINSIKKNSKFNHEILVHSNNSNDGTSKFLKDKNIREINSKYNNGLCTALNELARIAKFEYLLFLHDDMYICPKWDVILADEINSYNHNHFYLSGVMIEKINGHINYDFGDNYKNFKEDELLKLYDTFEYYDLQGSDKNPSLVHKELWNKIRGFSEEYYPGTGSDPDLNMKLWNEGVRIFKGINNCKVYHFGSTVSRRYKNHPTIKAESGSKGSKIFLLKWGISIKFFKKHFLKSDSKYLGPLKEPSKNFNYYLDLLICKIYFYYLKIFFKS